MSINATFLGNLGRQAEVKQTQKGPVTVFTVAVSDGYGDAKKTEWIECSLFGERGTKISQYLTKGSKVMVCGSLQKQDYTKKDGSQGSQLKVRVLEIEFAGATPNQTPPEKTVPNNFQDSELPF